MLGVPRRAMRGRIVSRTAWLPLLCLLVLPQREASAQIPYGRFRQARSQARRGDLNNPMSVARRRLAQVYEPPPCEWCHGRRDGTHADTLAEPPCSVFFTCRGGQLVDLDACPGGLCFDVASGRCEELCLGSCSSGRVREGGVPGTAAAYGDRHQGEPNAKRLRGQRGRAEGSGSVVSDRVLLRRPESAGSQGTELPQAKALLAFKHANSDPLGRLRTWRPPDRIVRGARAFYCTGWAGVTCANGTDDVVELKVSGVTQSDAKQPLFGDPSLRQSIPPQIGSLTALTALDLSYLGAYQGLTMGGLVGSIPSDLGSCTNLQSLNLNWNSLSGSLPDSLSKLTKLTFLNLGYNQFDCSFPPVLTTLASLAELDLYYVGFSGTIPEGVSRLTNLTRLTIKRTPIGGRLPSVLGSLLSLQYLDLASNPDVEPSSLPLSLSRLSNLQALTLRNMSLTGSLPSATWWSGLRKLTYLEIDTTQIEGTLPSSLPTSLQFLSITDSRVSGNISGSLIRSLCNRSAEAPTFAWLQLPGNQLSGRLPMELSMCSLSYLYLQNNALEGRVPRQLFGSTSALAASLMNFNIAGNKLSGNLPGNLLQTLASASLVNISWNAFSGAVPNVKYASPSLKTYDVSGNLFEGNVSDLLQLPEGGNVTVALSNSRFTGRVPKTWLRSIYALYMDGNPNITGPLPQPSDCSQLAYLDTSRTNCSGPIPNLLSKCPLLASWKSEESGLAGPIPSPKAKSGKRPLQQLLLAGNSLNGTLPSGLSQLHGLKALGVSRNALEGPLPPWLTSFVGLTTLDASHNGLSGPLLPELRVLGNLVTLSLSHNALSGSIPEELAPPNLNQSLRLMDLSFNQLNGSIPWGFNSSVYVPNLSNNQLSGQVPGYDQGTLASNPSALSNNSGLCGAPGFPACPVPGLTTGQLVGIILGTVFGSLLIGAVVGALCWRHWVRNHRISRWDGVLKVYHEFDPPLTIRTLLEASDEFSDEYLLGRGGFGSVYKVELPDGTVVAVKRLQEGSHQGNAEFEAEIETLGSVRHRNLVRLLAAYVSLPPYQERLLVYEFLPGGSLDSISPEDLPKGSPYRFFPVRRRICTDIARALKYLHVDCDPGILHCDMKPANVLLDEDHVARVADFGLAQVVSFQKGKEHMTMDSVFGTPGFVAPEYFALKRLSFKSDVYAYGVTLIRIMTGRRTTDQDIVAQGLQRWASAGGSAILDPSLVFEDEAEQEMAVGMIKLGVLCTSRVPVDRPGMQDVVQILENLEEFVASGGTKLVKEAR